MSKNFGRIAAAVVFSLVGAVQLSAFPVTITDPFLVTGSGDWSSFSATSLCCADVGYVAATISGTNGTNNLQLTLRSFSDLITRPPTDVFVLSPMCGGTFDDLTITGCNIDIGNGTGTGSAIIGTANFPIFVDLIAYLHVTSFTDVQSIYQGRPAETWTGTFDINPTPVPEPASLWFVLTGLLTGLVIWSCRFFWLRRQPSW